MARRKAAARKASGSNVHFAVAQFLYRQADLLDSKRWQEWIDLFTDAPR